MGVDEGNLQVIYIYIEREMTLENCPVKTLYLLY